MGKRGKIKPAKRFDLFVNSIVSSLIRFLILSYNFFFNYQIHFFIYSCQVICYSEHGRSLQKSLGWRTSPGRVCTKNKMVRLRLRLHLKHQLNGLCRTTAHSPVLYIPMRMVQYHNIQVLLVQGTSPCRVYLIIPSILNQRDSQNETQTALSLRLSIFMSDKNYCFPDNFLLEAKTRQARRRHQ